MGFVKHLKDDLPASVVVFFVAVPLCLGIALASGASAFSGLVAGIVGGLLVGGISKSQVGVSGPAAGLAVIVLDGIHQLPTFNAFLVAVVLAGVFQIGLGLARAGVLAYFFPTSVIKGMLAGIGIIIFLKQIPHAVGFDADPEGELSFFQPDGDTTFSALLRIHNHVEIGAVIVTTVALTLLILWDTVLSKRHKVFKLIQGPLVAVAFGIGYQLATSAFIPGLALSESHLVSVPTAESLGEFLGFFRTPDFSYLATSQVFTLGLTIAVVASLETLLCVEATDKLDPQKRVTPTNRELVAQGAGNMVSGLIGGLPITQVIVRSSANIQAGAKTQTSAIVHGALLLTFVALLPGLLNLIPLAVLASILFVVGFKLAKPALFKEMYKRGWHQLVPFVVTIVAMIFTDLLLGVALGMVVAVLDILRKNYLNSHSLRLEEHEEGTVHVVNLKLSEEVSFLNKASIRRALSKVRNGSMVNIDMSGSIVVDPDVYDVIEDFKESAKERDITVNVIQKRPELVHSRRPAAA